MLEPAAHDKHSGTDEALSMLWSSSLDSAMAIGCIFAALSKHAQQCWLDLCNVSLTGSVIDFMQTSALSSEKHMLWHMSWGLVRVDLQGGPFCGGVNFKVQVQVGTSQQPC